jgi:hypothetical protein
MEATGRAFLQSGEDPGRDLAQGRSRRAGAVIDKQWAAAVAGGGDQRVDRDPAKQGDTRRPDGAGLGDLGEDLDRLAAVRTGQGREVLHPTQDGDLRPAEQLKGLARAQVRHVLRADHDDRSGGADQPKQLLLEVGGARRKVHDKLLQLSPGDVYQQLAQHRLHQRGREGERLGFADQEPGDITRMPKRSTGSSRTGPDARHRSQERRCSRRASPIISGMSGPYRSASSRPTRRAWPARATARLRLSVDLPTPPLPLATATTRLAGASPIPGPPPAATSMSSLRSALDPARTG